MVPEVTPGLNQTSLPCLYLRCWKDSGSSHSLPLGGVGRGGREVGVGGGA